MIEKIDRNFKRSLAIAFLAHIFFFIITIPFIDLKYLGLEKKKESERMRARLVHLIRDTGGDQKEYNKSSQRSKSASTIQWQPRSTTIKLDETLPRITIPTIQESDRSIKEQNKPFKEEELKIKSMKKQDNNTSKNINIKIKAKESSSTRSGKEKQDLDGLDEALQKEIDKINKGPGTGKKNRPGTSLPGGLAIDEIVGGKGEIIWDDNNKMPVYPEEAKKTGMQGDVKLRLSLNTKGEVTQVFIEEKSGYPLLDKTAKKQARTWHIFIMEKGLSRPGIIKLTITFKLK